MLGYLAAIRCDNWVILDSSVLDNDNNLWYNSQGTRFRPHLLSTSVPFDHMKPDRHRRNPVPCFPTPWLPTPPPARLNSRSPPVEWAVVLVDSLATTISPYPHTSEY
jgi:hypothetical protein